ncbi:fatty acyl-CoA hydrolase precursor, medium chain isoform X1 [Alligator mississippiensis]|uniref:fatty acyl-CoA hydrolase precursor, medium chain isoform X1 n=1 Tax=Alligator mississippiensis TaxID=8496 RepID=UPI0028780FEC|nr:fatty acyl-CoA hydrolase precursor, medium chain isoform X1 [Alligator mississippiensis]
MSGGKNALLLSLVLTACFTALTANGQRVTQPEVDTKYGKLRGKQIQVGVEAGARKCVSVFLGIPFAKPPIGPLRFSPPQRPEPWQGVRDATSYPPMCLQDKEAGQLLSDTFTNRKEKVSLQMSEDCLYLNMYVPADSRKQEKLPVLVWLPGGGFVLGAASTYDGSAIAAFENVMFVTLQYRLGVLGFFTTGDEHARGNWGYLDQVAALIWIQENIAFFGGDPGSVTIFGESAGGASASALVLSPLAKGLFHKAISESGVAYSPLFTDRPREQTNRIARVSGCESPSSAKIVQCLREKSVKEIIKITLDLNFTTLYLSNASSPESKEHPVFIYTVVDGVFFPKSPKKILANKIMNKVPHIIGLNNDELGFMLPALLKFPPYVDGLDKETAIRVIKGLQSITKLPHKLVNRVFNEYVQNPKDQIQVRDGMLDLLEDVTFLVPSIVTARYHRDAGNPVYFYQFCHRPSEDALIKPPFVKADHGSELGYVLGKPFLAGGATEDEIKLSRTMMKYWANFAHYGTPNGHGLVKWPAYGKNEQYLVIDLQQKVAKKLKEDKVAFWTKLLPVMMPHSQGEHPGVGG